MYTPRIHLNTEHFRETGITPCGMQPEEERTTVLFEKVTCVKCLKFFMRTHKNLADHAAVVLKGLQS